MTACLFKEYGLRISIHSHHTTDQFKPIINTEFQNQTYGPQNQHPPQTDPTKRNLSKQTHKKEKKKSKRTCLTLTVLSFKTNEDTMIKTHTSKTTISKSQNFFNHGSPITRSENRNGCRTNRVTKIETIFSKERRKKINIQTNKQTNKHHEPD